MASEIRVPRLGWSMEQGVFLGWRKREGENVEPGEILFDLEGEKAAQEIEALDAGVLRIAPDAPNVGDTVPVGALLGYLAEPGESVSFNAPAESARAQNHPEPASPKSTSSPSRQRPAASPSVRRRARELGVSLDQLADNAALGRVTQQHLHAASTKTNVVGSASATVGNKSRHRNRATPRARRVARERGIDLGLITGTGRHGRIRERDVLAGRRTSTAQNGSRSAARMPITKLRQIIARRMLTSHQSTAPVTLTTRMDATNLVSLRLQFKSAGSEQAIPSFTDIVAKLVALALAKHPEMAAQWQDDHLSMPDPASLAIGIAVDTEEGLVVPVLRDVQVLTLRELAVQSTNLIQRARSGRLQASELDGGHFTITNLGAFGIDAFTPIINHPQCAILGLGAIRREAVVDSEGQIVARDQMTLSLTFDHRLVDGAPAARFLATVRSALENPSAWLLSM